MCCLSQRDGPAYGAQHLTVVAHDGMSLMSLLSTSAGIGTTTVAQSASLSKWIDTLYIMPHSTRLAPGSMDGSSAAWPCTRSS